MTASRFTFVIILTLGLSTAPFAARAEQSGKGFRIGFVGTVPLTDPAQARLWGAFVQGLRELGYLEGQNITIERRFSEGRPDRFPRLLADLIRVNVDLIVALPAAQLAAKQATRTIPIVAAAGDPVGSGLVASLARPGGNITGPSSIVSPEIVGKQLQLLKEIVPQVSRVAVLGYPTNPKTYTLWLGEAKVAARSLGVQLQTLGAGPDAFEGAFAAMTRERAGALLVIDNAIFHLHKTRIADSAAKNRLPAVYQTREYVDAGGLLSYGASLPDALRRAAVYVDKILRGAKPADLPIEQPTKFELVINLKSAGALGLTIPPSLLVRADEVIK